jgi:DNA modification methylase
MNELHIEYLPIWNLHCYRGNARTHSPGQIHQIANSIKAFGFITPLLVDAENQLIAGHGRLLAAKQLGLHRIPVIRVDHLDEAQRHAYMLADNRIAENAGWDKQLLRVELEFLMRADIDFDVDLTGFSTPEINLLINPSNEPADEVDVPDPPPAGEAVSGSGDVWILGPHRIICGDCRDHQVVARLLDGNQTRIVITDPPYNVPIAGHVCGLGKHQHDNFAMAAGEMSPAQFTQFLQDSLGAMTDSCVDGALVYCFMDWRHLPELYSATAALNLSPINLCAWVKSNAGMGSLYRSQHELVLVLKKGDAPHVNNVELGKHGRYRTNVWNYAGMNSFGADRDEALALHPTVKPVAMIRDAIQDVSNHGDIVLDGFLGSGTTLLAAHQCKRRCFGIELDPRYIDVAIERWIALTGDSAVHVESGLTFTEQRERRYGVAV